MTPNQESQESTALLPVPRVESGRSLKFGKDTGFQAELRRRVDDFFQRTGRRPRDCPRMYFKIAILLTWFTANYVLLVMVVQTVWLALPLAVLLGLATAAIGFNIQHDGGHLAVSNYGWINKLMAMSLDVIGGSSHLWHWKHGIFHHTYVNITGHDTDIDLGTYGRLSPHQKWRPIHRWQHYYLWALYGLLAIKWQMFDDYHDAIVGRCGDHRVPRPKGWGLFVFLAGKATFLTLVFGIPLLFHSLGVVLLFYTLTALVVGVVLSIVFQLAHVVEQADFPMPRADTGRIEQSWTVHQVETTVDFARRSRIVSWLVGGLNFQIEHHLFPRICHVHYPALSKVVEETCRDFGVRYQENRTLWDGIVAHFRWLRRMGRRPPPALPPEVACPASSPG